ncbi:zinc finger protein ZFP2-like [Adelges cooleyi]|uniref:zinc finger protein ZFP2-like n=1 Tax=Adelges cooleyi TaxID=133065 RepID=UPI00217F242B|nr:zinc finger protein ZFP2-like [Adelges cooleyi]
MNKFDINLNELCRLCLVKTSELRPILNADNDLSTRIQACVGIEVQHDTRIGCMCINCLNHLENWENFRDVCIASNKQIQEYFNHSDGTKFNSLSDILVKCGDALLTSSPNYCEDQHFDNESLKSNSSIELLIQESYARTDKHNFEKLDGVNTKIAKKKKYECGICLTIFTNKDSLYKHLINVHFKDGNNTNIPHYCLVCSKGYYSYQNFQDHLKSNPKCHTQSQNEVKSHIFGCGLCACKFSQSRSLYRHLRSHALKNDLIPHLCSFCHTGFLDAFGLSLHTSAEHQDISVSITKLSKQECSDRQKNTLVSYRDELCLKSMGNINIENECKDNDNSINIQKTRKKIKTLEDKRAKYREHYRRFQSKTYSCEFCNVAYSRFCDLSSHDRTTHDDMAKEFSCPTCGKLFLTDSRLKIHQNAFHSEKIFSCDICNVRCKSKPTLRTHMRKHSGMFTCSYCNLTTASNAALVTHIRVHTGEKPFVCDMCGNSYASKLGLTSHKRTHLHEKLFKCNICGYTGSSHSSIYIHKQTHNSNKPYVCDVCGKTFKIKVRLVDHQKIHFGIKNYVCEVCNKAFLARYQLIQHSRTHSGEKPFQCQLCSKAFARKDGLSEHMRTHTGEKRYTCSECFKTFSFYKSMKNHKCISKQSNNKEPVQLSHLTLPAVSIDISPSNILNAN